MSKNQLQKINRKQYSLAITMLNTVTMFINKTDDNIHYPSYSNKPPRNAYAAVILIYYFNCQINSFNWEKHSPVLILTYSKHSKRLHGKKLSNLQFTFTLAKHSQKWQRGRSSPFDSLLEEVKHKFSIKSYAQEESGA